jgi:hypothetical protein
VVAVGTEMNIDGELSSELAAMADAWLVRQGQRDTTARPSKDRQVDGRVVPVCPCDDSGT